MKGGTRVEFRGVESSTFQSENECCNRVVFPAAVEACLSQGLRRRALGLFKTSSTTALLHKVAKNFPPAELISRKVLEIESVDPIR